MSNTPEQSPRHKRHHENKTKLLDVIQRVLQNSPLPPPPLNITSGDEALARLLKGNELWAKGEMSIFIQHLVHEITPEVRKGLVNNQAPYAAIITCSDSRVSPELIFDEGIGMLFIIRVAGNVIDPISLGSIEYAVANLKTPLLVLMGHQHCGAVKATLENVKESAEQGNIASLLKLIQPAVDKIKQEVDIHADPEKALDMAVQENVRMSKKKALEHSHIIRSHVESGKLMIVTAEYYLDTGRVQII